MLSIAAIACSAPNYRIIHHTTLAAPIAALAGFLGPQVFYIHTCMYMSEITLYTTHTLPLPPLIIAHSCRHLLPRPIKTGPSPFSGPQIYFPSSPSFRSPISISSASSPLLRLYQITPPHTPSEQHQHQALLRTFQYPRPYITLSYHLEVSSHEDRVPTV